MRAAMSALVLKNLRICSDMRIVSQRGPIRIVVPFQQYSDRAEDSSSSGWGTGEPPIDEKQTQRGVPQGQPSSAGAASGESAVGRQSTETSTTGFDTGENASKPEAKKQSKKSRTGADMTDDGQVVTPNLDMRSTHDIFKHKGKETEDRLAAERKGS